jgi:tetratricopeptide (TPR) repeat protein
MMEHDRTLAARHLRAARRLPADEAMDAVAWARCAVPASVPALRLEARLALAHGDASAADAIIAQGLLLRRNDPTLLALLADRLSQRGLHHRAEDAITRALTARPAHRATHLVAAKCAERRGRSDDMIRHLEAAVAWPPDGRGEAEAALVRAHLACREIDRAEALVVAMQPAAPTLRALVLQARGELMRAIEVLDAARPSACSATERDSLDAVLIDLLDQHGDLSRLGALGVETPDDQPASHIALAKWSLSRGAFDDAIARAERLLERGQHQDESLIVLAVAQFMIGDEASAADSVSAVSAHDHALKAFAADCWRRAALGRSIQSLTAGESPSRWGESSPLGRLLHSSLLSLEGAGDDDLEAGRHAEVCRRLLRMVEPAHRGTNAAERRGATV